MGIIVSTIDTIAHETLLFGAVGFLIGGIDDLAIDLIWFWHRLRARFGPPPALDSLGAAMPGRIAIFVAAWHEAGVIGAMLDRALAQIDHADYRIYVSTYPNDPATIAAVAAVADRDARVHLVIGPRDGPSVDGHRTGKGREAGFAGIRWDVVGQDWPKSAVSQVMHRPLRLIGTKQRRFPS